MVLFYLFVFISVSLTLSCQFTASPYIMAVPRSKCYAKWLCGSMDGPRKTVAVYRHLAEECRHLAGKLEDSKDKLAIETMAEAWDKIADACEAELRRMFN
jgi:hypothetical protein